MTQDQVLEDFEKMRLYGIRRGWFESAEIQPSDRHGFFVTMHGYRLPERFGHRRTTVYFEVPSGFPFAAPRGHFTENRLKFDNGGYPACISPDYQLARGLDLVQAWFWRLVNWNPSKFNLTNYLQTMQMQLTRWPG